MGHAAPVYGRQAMNVATQVNVADFIETAVAQVAVRRFVTFSAAVRVDHIAADAVVLHRSAHTILPALEKCRKTDHPALLLVWVDASSVFERWSANDSPKVLATLQGLRAQESSTVNRRPPTCWR
jgi:hypothetical protein